MNNNRSNITNNLNTKNCVDPYYTVLDIPESANLFNTNRIKNKSISKTEKNKLSKVDNPDNNSLKLNKSIDNLKTALIPLKSKSQPKKETTIDNSIIDINITELAKQQECERRKINRHQIQANNNTRTIRNNNLNESGYRHRSYKVQCQPLDAIFVNQMFDPFDSFHSLSMLQDVLLNIQKI